MAKRTRLHSAKTLKLMATSLLDTIQIGDRVQSLTPIAATDGTIVPTGSKGEVADIESVGQTPVFDVDFNVANAVKRAPAFTQMIKKI